MSFLTRVFASINIINLKRSADRWKGCEEEFKKIGVPLCSLERVDAIDASDLDLQSLIDGKILKSYHTLSKRGAAISASHVSVWKKIHSSSSSSPSSWHLILEDDFRLHPKFKELFPTFWNSVPENAEVVFLGSSSGLDSEETLLNQDRVVPLNSHIFTLKKSLHGAFAYAIKKETAKKLLETHVPLAVPVDFFPVHSFNCYAFRSDPVSVSSAGFFNSFHRDKHTWDGRINIFIHGLVSVRPVKHT